MGDASIARIWVGDITRSGNIHTQLTLAILSMISPANTGNHNKKLTQLVQNIVAQFLGEVDNCVAANGTVAISLMRQAFANSVAPIFAPYAGTSTLVPSGDFVQSINAYTASHSADTVDFITSGVLSFSNELRQFIAAWCRTYDKTKPDARPLELMLYYKFDDTDTTGIIKNLVAARVTTAHNLSKLARTKRG